MLLKRDGWDVNAKRIFTGFTRRRTRLSGQRSGKDRTDSRTAEFGRATESALVNGFRQRSAERWPVVPRAMNVAAALDR